jgi:plastocyanin
MRRALPVVLALALAGPPAAQAAEPSIVSAQFETFAPTRLDVLPGQIVRWQNVSERMHTVTADDGSFDSGDLPAAAAFERAFDVVGAFPYHCTIHPGMVGEVDVSPVLLDQLPTQAVPAGNPVTFSGRTAAPSEAVRVERAMGTEYETVATAQPAGDGTWSVAIEARASGDYRAANAAGASRSRNLLVSDRQVLVRRTANGLAVTVTPPAPYRRIALQLDLRDRFGWWPAVRSRLDYLSEARFRVPRRTRARVVLLADDGWTPLATSRVVNDHRQAAPHREDSAHVAAKLNGDGRADSTAHTRQIAP